MQRSTKRPGCEWTPGLRQTHEEVGGGAAKGQGVKERAWDGMQGGVKERLMGRGGSKTVIEPSTEPEGKEWWRRGGGGVWGGLGPPGRQNKPHSREWGLK